MSRQALNEAFLRTSFLNSANAPYIEEMQAAVRAQSRRRITTSGGDFLKASKKPRLHTATILPAPHGPRRLPLCSMKLQPTRISSAL